MKDYISMIPSKDVRNYLIESKIELSNRQKLEVIRSTTIYDDDFVELVAEFYDENIKESNNDDELKINIQKFIEAHLDFLDTFVRNDEESIIYQIRDTNQIYNSYHTYLEAIKALKLLVKEANYKYIKSNNIIYSIYKIYISDPEKEESIDFIVDNNHNIRLYNVCKWANSELYDKVFNYEAYIPAPFKSGDRVKPYTNFKGYNYDIFGLYPDDYDSKFDYWFINKNFDQDKMLNTNGQGFSDLPMISFDGRNGCINRHIHGIKTWMLEYETEQISDWKDFSTDKPETWIYTGAYCTKQFALQEDFPIDYLSECIVLLANLHTSKIINPNKNEM